jgi:hypothetical protein
MKRRRVNVKKMPEASEDLSFPVPYSEQAKFLKLADDFLVLEEQPQETSNVIPMPDRTKKAA